MTLRRQALRSRMSALFSRPRKRPIPTAAVLLIFAALPALAGPAELFLGESAAALRCGGSWAPPALLGAARADFPTTLHASPGPCMILEVGAQAPLTLRTGRREYGELTTHSRELRLTVPTETGRDAAWRLGVVGSTTSLNARHRLRRDTTTLTGGSDALSLGAAWSDGRWTLGAARTVRDGCGRLAGVTIARLQRMRRGTEGVLLADHGSLDTIAAEFRRDDWRAGAQVASGNGRARVEADIRRTVYRGLFSSSEQQRHVWAVVGPDCAQWFGWISETHGDPGTGAIFAGETIRGRATTDTRTTAWGLGRRRAGSRVRSRIELSGRRDTVELSAYVNQGVLGSLTGQDRGGAELELDSLALRWAEERRDGHWSYRYGCSAQRIAIDFAGHLTSVDGPIALPETTWNRRLDHGRAWLVTVMMGAGYGEADWRADANLAMSFGDFGGVLTDLTTAPPATPGDPGAPRPRPEPQPGPSTELDPGWVLAVSLAREL